MTTSDGRPNYLCRILTRAEALEQWEIGPDSDLAVVLFGRGVLWEICGKEGHSTLWPLYTIQVQEG